MHRETGLGCWAVLATPDIQCDAAEPCPTLSVQTTENDSNLIAAIDSSCPYCLGHTIAACMADHGVLRELRADDAQLLGSVMSGGDVMLVDKSFRDQMLVDECMDK